MYEEEIIYILMILVKENVSKCANDLLTSTQLFLDEMKSITSQKPKELTTNARAIVDISKKVEN